MPDGSLTRGLINRLVDEAQHRQDKPDVQSQFASVMPIRQKAG